MQITLYKRSLIFYDTIYLFNILNFIRLKSAKKMLYLIITAILIRELKATGLVKKDEDLNSKWNELSLKDTAYFDCPSNQISIHTQVSYFRNLFF